MNGIAMRFAASGFGLFISEKQALNRLQASGRKADLITRGLFINGEYTTIQEAVKLATLESEENDMIPKKFFMQLSALKYLYEQGYRLSLD